MSWQTLLNNGIVRTHATTIQELESLRSVVDRDLKDATLIGLSADHRFSIAYNAVLQLANMAIACVGYRLAVGEGHHKNTLGTVQIDLDPSSVLLATYFQVCRRKRNKLTYDVANIVSETEAAELLAKVVEFRSLVEDFIGKSHPHFKARP